MVDPGTAIAVFVVEDHAIVREGLVGMLTTCDDIVVVGSAADGERALRDLAERDANVVLLDLQLPGRHGLEVLAELKERPDPPKVIVLTVHDDDDLVLRAVRSGADGYVLKQATLQELLDAIRKVAAGGRALGDVVAEAFIAEAEREATAALTRRELDVLRLVADGASNREVARALYLSTSTVKSYLDDIYRKLEVSDRAHAVAVALRRGLLE